MTATKEFWLWDMDTANAIGFGTEAEMREQKNAILEVNPYVNPDTLLIISLEDTDEAGDR